MSPAFPAAWLLFALMFVMAIAHFLALPWSSVITLIVYLIPVLWYLVILRSRFTWALRLNSIDVGFFFFCMIIIVSATLFPGLDEGGAVWKYLRFLPFLVVAPYLLGRLMTLQDIKLFLKVLIFATPVLLPFLVLDRMTLDERAWRLPIFGLDHGPLVVGGFLAAALVATCVCLLRGETFGKENSFLQVLCWLALTCLAAGLVWVMARGWLIAGVIGVVVTCLAARMQSVALRLGILVYVVTVVSLALFTLPKLSFYAAVLTPPPASLVLAAAGTEDATTLATEACPILGEESCKPLKAGVNSVAIRWVLYREAIEMFTENPVLGVGAARFGDCSCTGPGWYPHSTILQGFAELGLIGGGLQAGLFILSVVNIFRLRKFAVESGQMPLLSAVLGFFILFLVADQFYGTYLMAAGTWMMVGVSAGLRSQIKLERANV